MCLTDLEYEPPIGGLPLGVLSATDICRSGELISGRPLGPSPFAKLFA